jgi:hypothetical protein
MGDAPALNRKRDLGIATTWMRRVRIGAEWSQPRCLIRDTDHREGSRLVFAVERSELSGVVRWKTAGGSVLRIVDPKTYVEGVGGWQGCVRIEAEDLVEQDRLDANVPVVGLLSNLNVRLVPCKTEAALEVRIGRFIRQERAALHRKEIEGETGFESIEIQNHRVIEFAANYRSPGPGLFIRGFAKAIDKLRICHQIKADFVFLVLGRGREWGDDCSHDGNQSKDDCARPKILPALPELVFSHCILHFV